MTTTATTIALFGAGGKMGFRCAEHLKDRAEHRTLYVEVSQPGIERLHGLGLSVTPGEQAAREANVVILAVPDTLIGRVAREIVPLVESGTLIITLDPAAPYSGKLPERADISYFVTHPCHPPLFSDETDPAARHDHFGGVAGQHIVCALMQGTEADYERGVEIARDIFAPVLKVHRVTVEQMARLEPGLVETVSQTCLSVIRDAFEATVQAGVPREAAYDFLMGHMNVQIGILFGLVNARFSDGALLALERGRQRLIRPDWKEVLDIENVKKEVRIITEGTAK